MRTYSYTWSARGQMLAEYALSTAEGWTQGYPVRTFTYDGAGQMVEATVFTLTTRFRYNGLGARVAVEVVGLAPKGLRPEGQGATTYTLDYAAGNRILAETTDAGSTLYLYGRDCLGELRGDDWLYYLSDAEGLVRQGTDGQGQVVSNWLFDPDGTVLEGPEGSVSHLVCGGVYDWSTGLIYKDGRYFDPMLGIWLALIPLVVVQSWRGWKKKRRGFPWVWLLLLGVCVGVTLTACGPGSGNGTPTPDLIPCVEPPTDTPGPPPTDTPTPTPTPTTVPPTNTPGLAGTAYITIDDGPGGFTSQVLDVLARHQIKATFFVLGDRIQSFPDEIRRMKTEGHAIGVHSWSHPWWGQLTAEQQMEEIRQTQEALKEVTGEYSNLFRAPGGAPTIADIQHLYNYNWTVDSFDYKYDVNTIVKLVFEGDDSLEIGSQALAIDNANWHQPIILIHSIHSIDPPALDLIAQGLEERGYSFGILPRPGDSPGTGTITSGN